MMVSSPTIERLRALPEAEVHVHLEGCFEACLLEQWANKFGKPMPRPRESLFRFEGLANFPSDQCTRCRI
jgi:adenosine deaminase